MDMSSDENSEFSESEFDDEVKKSYAQLKDGCPVRKNANGTLRCPFCLGKKRREYQYKELLQHASGVANSTKDLERAAKHRALELILKEDAEQLMSSSAPMTESRPPKRVRLECKEERFVWPWMAIIAMPTTLEDGTPVTNGRVRAQFSEFTPVKTTLMWDARGFRGMVVIEFEKSWTGFYCAISFEKSFEMKHQSKIEWTQSGKCGSNMYAWLAREDDYYNSDDYIKTQLHRGDLRTIRELQEEEERKKNILIDDLTFRIDERNKELQSSVEQLMEMDYSLNQFKSALERKRQ